MRFVIAAICAVLFFSPVKAANELKGVSIEVLSDDSRISVEALNEADSATMDAATGPRPVEGAAVYLIKHGDYCIIALVVAGTIQVSTNPMKLEIINKILKRTDA
jgi:hypothetical protein